MTPRVIAGGVTAVVAGGLMAALTASAGGLAGSVVGIAALTLTLVVAGMTYGWLVDSERLPEGFGSGILFWTAALPAARVAHEILVGDGVPDGVIGFVIYQALVGGAFGLGFLLLQNQISTLIMNSRS
ncbi:MAG: hypothetical protein ACRDJB_08690, partial [Actinomycetota bacterium]